ncbi:unnamed protein product (macronuclear) [Paramecium tetraurelia]|uniref:RNase H type-1 domain-containing protein n=1 Tax=Paramecium tetraurelia TaxID=5888 RepID=A0DYB8_PARTE|nr:uncharacterized protein GSPATT00003003001 [Paramecium tetraurelia]CAK88035.1 unnamed protein product [Paramecium tetraurelia]|eukprot:XP_001455432.1 hypothetical protein (macronuclear) [Paramecium tetraurelia strain d4-2]
MYSKAPQHSSAINLGNKNDQLIQSKKQQPYQQQSSKAPITIKQEPPQLAQKPIQNVVRVAQQQPQKEINFSSQRQNNKIKNEPKEEDYQNSSQKNSDSKNQSLINQLREEKEQSQQLQRELKQTQDYLNQVNKEVEKKIKQSQQDLEKKLNDLKKEGEEEKKKTQTLTADVKKLKDQLKNAETQTQKKLDQQKKQYEIQMQELEQVILEKQQQIDEIAQEFQNYNLEEIQAKMEEMANDINMKDQLIDQLQSSLQNGEGNLRDDQNPEKEDIVQEIQQKDQEIKKLEELIENFKQLYQHMLDEKQVIMEENEKLANENDQFREIFSQNLHLFGIDPNQLEEEGEGEGEDREEREEGEDGEDGYQQEEGIYLIQLMRQLRKMRPIRGFDIQKDHFPNITQNSSFKVNSSFVYFFLHLLNFNCNRNYIKFQMKLKSAIVFLDYSLKPRVFQLERYAIKKLEKPDGYKLIYFKEFEKAQQFASQVQQLIELKQVQQLQQMMISDIKLIKERSEKDGEIREISVEQQQSQNDVEKNKQAENTIISNCQLDNIKVKQVNNQFQKYEIKQKDSYDILDDIDGELKCSSLSIERLVNLEILDLKFENLLHYYPRNTLKIIPIQPDNLYTLYFDGASKSNPGPAGAGVALFDKMQQIKEITQPLGKQTNNVAEFLALFLGIRYTLNLGINYLECFGDSKLIIDGMNNKINFKQQHLEDIRVAIYDYAQLFKMVRYTHISRNQNEIADKLASAAALQSKKYEL